MDSSCSTAQLGAIGLRQSSFSDYSCNSGQLMALTGKKATASVARMNECIRNENQSMLCELDQLLAAARNFTAQPRSDLELESESIASRDGDFMEDLVAQAEEMLAFSSEDEVLAEAIQRRRLQPLPGPCKVSEGRSTRRRPRELDMGVINGSVVQGKKPLALDMQLITGEQMDGRVLAKQPLQRRRPQALDMPLITGERQPERKRSQRQAVARLPVERQRPKALNMHLIGTPQWKKALKKPGRAWAQVLELFSAATPPARASKARPPKWMRALNPSRGK